MQHGQGVGIKDCRQSLRLQNGTAPLNWKGTKLPHCSAAPITAKWCGALRQATFPLILRISNPHNAHQNGDKL